MKSHPFHARQEAEPEVAGRLKKKKKKKGEIGKLEMLSGSI